MARKIRVSVEISSPNDSTEYEALPEKWDELSEWEQEEYLTSVAVNALAYHASSGASVVEVDDNGNEI